MDYGLPKTLPATGAAVIAGATVFDQLIVIAGIGLLTFAIALTIRTLWRRKQSIGE